MHLCPRGPLLVDAAVVVVVVVVAAVAVAVVLGYEAASSTLDLVANITTHLHLLAFVSQTAPPALSPFPPTAAAF